jgi:hypothetical protein
MVVRQQCNPSQVFALLLGFEFLTVRPGLRRPRSIGLNNQKMAPRSFGAPHARLSLFQSDVCGSALAPGFAPILPEGVWRTTPSFACPTDFVPFVFATQSCLIRIWHSLSCAGQSQSIVRIGSPATLLYEPTKGWPCASATLKLNIKLKVRQLQRQLFSTDGRHDAPRPDAGRSLAHECCVFATVYRKRDKR